MSRPLKNIKCFLMGFAKNKPPVNNQPVFFVGLTNISFFAKPIRQYLVFKSSSSTDVVIEMITQIAYYGFGVHIIPR